MHIKLLKVFCDVAVRRSFSRGAKENEVSQSAASQMVQQLEERLGVKLLDRSKRPLVLTPEGTVFYRGCRKLVDRYIALEEEVRTLHEEVAGRVRVASIYSVGLSHMNQSVQEFLGRHPKANVRIEYQHPDRVYELVERDQADVGLVSYPQSSRTIGAIPWRREPMAVVCAPGHEFADRQRIDLRDLHGQRLVSFDSNLQIRREIDRVLGQQGIEIQIVMEFDNTETIKRAIEINAGIGLLPAPTVEREVASQSLGGHSLAAAKSWSVRWELSSDGGRNSRERRDNSSISCWVMGTASRSARAPARRSGGRPASGGQRRWFRHGKNGERKSNADSESIRLST